MTGIPGRPRWSVIQLKMLLHRQNKPWNINDTEGQE
jgi:hypothetical protein